MSAVVVALTEQLPRRSGDDFKLPAVLVELTAVFLLEPGGALSSRGSWLGCDASFLVDLVSRNGGAFVGATTGVGGAGAESVNGFLCCACVAADDSCLVLWQCRRPIILRTVQGYFWRP
jgi:hypothetical protein